MSMEKIIYLSFAQGTNIDGAKLAGAVSAVMVRAGQGIWEDPLFRQNYKICIDNHIPFGIWWFDQPNMNAQPQVDAFMKVWSSLPIKPIVIAYDVEEIDYQDDNGIWQKLFPPSRQFSHDNVLAWCKQIKAATGARVGIYTRKYYFQDWTYETEEWYQFWMWIAAWYLYTGEIKPALPWNWPEYKIHQYEGGGQGTPGVDPAQTCKEYFNGTHAELLEFFGVTGGSTMAAIYNTQVAQKDRAKILTLENDQRIQTGYGAANLGIDAVILPMGGMSNWDGSHWKTLTESTFPGRFDLFAAANIPVLGRFELDAGAMIAEQHGDAEFKNRLIVDNFILPFLINAWHIGPWTWESIFAKQGKWRAISALILSEVKQTPYKFVPPNDYWQRLIWDYIVDHLRLLMLNSQIPTVPILMYSGGWWLRQYPGEMAQELQNDRDWLYLHLGHWVRTSTATFDTLAGIFAFPPDDSFTFALTNPAWNVPDGYSQRVLLHEFTGEAQKCRQIVDAAGNPSAVNLSLWNDTKEAMLKFLNAGSVEPGNPCAEQEAYIVELSNQIASLQAQMVEMNNTIFNQGEIINDLANRLAASEAEKEAVKLQNAKWEVWWTSAPK